MNQRCYAGVTKTGHECFCKRCAAADDELPEWDGVNRGAKMGHLNQEGQR